MKQRRILIRFVIVVGILLMAIPVMAKPITQTINLAAGWNAVFLAVEPVWSDELTEAANPGKEANDPEIVFADISASLESVWRWNPNIGVTPAEFIINPEEMISDQAGMLTYCPTAPPIVSNLHAISGNTAYLIKMSAPATFTVRGEPSLRKIRWKSNSYNLVGFRVPDVPGTFASFFAADMALSGRVADTSIERIYTLQNDNWVARADSETMARGEAFWIYCEGSTNFNGPIDFKSLSLHGLNYGTKLDEQEITLCNQSEQTLTLTLTPTDNSYPIYSWNFDARFDDTPDTTNGQWLPANTWPTVTLPPGACQSLRLGVKRAEYAGTADKVVTNLEITDSESMQKILVPVSFEPVESAGLWVGSATINQVCEVRQGPGLKKTGSAFNFRLIIHVDSSGNARLLSRVFEMWQDGTWKDDPDNPGHQIVAEPGRFVLLSDKSLVNNYEGSAMLDGRLIGRRISSTAFGFDEPKELGTFSMSGSLTASITTSAESPVNPFRHKYHPKYSSGIETKRTITMTFSDTDANGNQIIDNNNLNWGSSIIGGRYSETIVGLTRKNINIGGFFTLHKVCNTETLIIPEPE